LEKGFEILMLLIRTSRKETAGRMGISSRFVGFILVWGLSTGSSWGSEAEGAPAWLQELPPASRLLAAYPGSDPHTYSVQAAAFAVFVDLIEVRSGVDQSLMGAALIAKLPPVARPPWREYVAHGYSKILMGESWKLYADPAFRAEVLSRFLPPTSAAEYEAARNHDRDAVAIPSAAPRDPAPNPPAGNADAAALAVEGKKYQKAENYPKAIAAFKKALAIEPANQDALFGLANCYVMQDEWQLAVSVCKQYLTLVQPYPPMLVLLGLAYFRLQEYDSAAKALNSALELKPEPKLAASAQNLLGRSYNAQEKYAEAASALNQGLRITPEDAVANYDLGYAYRMLGEHQKAFVFLQKAVLLRPKYPLALLHLGWAYLDLGKKDEALQTYRTLQAIDTAKAQKLFKSIKYFSNTPGAHAKAMAWVAGGDEYRHAKEYRKAIEAYKKAVETESGNEDAWYGLAISFDRTGEWESAVSSWNDFLTVGTPSPEDLIILGMDHFELGHHEDALKSFRTALTLEPDAQVAADAQFWIGKTCNAMDKYANAIPALDEAVRFDPKDAAALSQLGYSYSMLGQNQKALAAAQKAESLEPEEGEVLLSVGLAYFILGMKDKALRVHARLQKIDKTAAAKLNKAINDAAATSEGHREH
jgi:tetratricopeptide (TPR) repeat protein